MLAPEGVQTGLIAHVPHPDALVLGVGEDQLLSRMEDGAGHVVVMTSTRVHLPGLQHLNDK